MATPSLGYQNFFSTTLSSAITASDTTIYLNSLPTPSEGYLVIEPDSSTNREIIYYTSKGANFVTCPSVAAGRGVGGTTGISHSSGVAVQMNNNAELWTSLQDGSALSGMHTWFDESFQDYIQSGGTITQATGLIASVSSGVTYINGRRLTFGSFSKTFTASKDTYVDMVAPSTLNNTATVSYVELASGATGSTPTSNGVHMGFVNSSAAAITTISQGGFDLVADSLGNLIYPTNAYPRLLGYKKITSSFTTATSGSDVDVTGLSVTVTVPAGRTLKITGFCSGLGLNGGTASVLNWKVKEGSTVLAGNDSVSRNANDSWAANAMALVQPSAGAHTYKIAVQQSAGSQTLTVNASSTEPAFIFVELL